ncbi:TPA: aldehyde dehydrogenase family protein [Serratia marcescens]|nr:aldehyde dehydrogenase family protein [Serratia marcescens]
MPNARYAAISGQQFIGGQRRAEGEAALLSLRADDGQPTGYRFHQATAAETAAAAEAAAAAFAPYSQLSAEQRANFLDAIAEEIDALDDVFFAFAMQETALPQARLSGERARTSGQMRLFATLLRRGDVEGVRIDCALPQRSPLPRPDLRQYRTALGPVAVFGASNFPLAFSTAGGDTAAALAAGCPIVFKAHSGHMITAELTAQAIERARERTGMPPGVFNMIFGNRVGADLVQHPAIQAEGALLLQADPLLQQEVFGPVSILVAMDDEAQLHAALAALQGQLTATLLADDDDLAMAAGLTSLLARKAGRVLFNGYPTGVEVCDAMVHGGPYPATSDARGTSVGTLAIERFLRPVCLQNTPAALLPPALQDANPLNLLRLVNGVYTRDPLVSPAQN